MSTALTTTQGTQEVVHGFGEQRVQRIPETASVAAAAREQAQIQARYIMAMQHTRNFHQFRQDLLNECRRAGFAEEAIYAKPVGKKRDPETGNWVETYAEGFSIRFVESALQCYRNCGSAVSTVFENDEIRIIRVSVEDFERNVPHSVEVVVEKTVERKGKQKGKEWLPPEGRTILSERLNSYGEPTYRVLATPDEVAVKANALRSKEIRNCGLRVLPSDVLAEARDVIRQTREKADREDPGAAVKKIIDGFARIGVRAQDIQDYLCHTLDNISLKELNNLRSLYTAIKDGEVSWHEATEQAKTLDAGEGRDAAKQAAIQKLIDLHTKQGTLATPDQKSIIDELLEKLGIAGIEILKKNQLSTVDEIVSIQDANRIIDELQAAADARTKEAPAAKSGKGIKLS